MLGFELEGEKKKKKKTWSRSDSGWKLEAAVAGVVGVRELWVSHWVDQLVCWVSGEPGSWARWPTGDGCGGNGVANSLL